jgi:hypothetical protein
LGKNQLRALKVGYLVSSFLTILPGDPHGTFIYFIPSHRLAYDWINDWIYSRFHAMAGRLGPDAVLIAPPNGRDNYRDPSVDDAFVRALDPDDEISTHFLYDGFPFLVVSRQPVCPSDQGKSIPFAAINLACLDEAKLGKLFDDLIDLASSGGDVIGCVPDIGLEFAMDEFSDTALHLQDALELKPHVFGIGLNGNVLLNWLRRRRNQQKRAKMITPVDGQDR